MSSFARLLACLQFDVCLDLLSLSLLLDYFFTEDFVVCVCVYVLHQDEKLLFAFQFGGF